MSKRKTITLHVQEQAREIIALAAQVVGMKTADFIRYAATRSAQEVLKARKEKEQ